MCGGSRKGIRCVATGTVGAPSTCIAKDALSTQF